MGYTKQLKQQMTRLSGQITNAAEWFHFYSFDVMGDLAFGKSFDMLQAGEQHFALDLLQEAMRPAGIISPVPWLFCILTSIPGLGTGFKTFISWCAEQVEQRKKVSISHLPKATLSILIYISMQIEMEASRRARWMAARQSRSCRICPRRSMPTASCFSGGRADWWRSRSMPQR